MSETASPNRWIPFQCPACHGLFRIRRNQVGLTGRCPTCGVAVKAADKIKSGEVEAAPEFALKDLAVAKTLSPEEIEKRDEASKQRKRHFATGMSPVIDWEEQGESSEEQKISWKIVGSLLIAMMVLGALGVYYINQKETPPQVKQSQADDEAETQAILDEIVAAKGRPGAEGTRDEGDEAVENDPKFDLLKVEAKVKSFLTAKSLEEMKEHVRDLERVGPLMDQYYEQVDFESRGFESMDKLQIFYRGNIINCAVQMADFLTAPIALERIVGQDVEEFWVDWENWVGYCEYLPEEMRSQKPAEPFLMRVFLEPANYYNYGFKDDKKWSSYGLELRNSDYAFIGYAVKNSELDQKLQLLLKNAESVSGIIKAAYPEGARAKDQLEILEMVTEGWILNESSSDANE